jgi:HPt (histidine-containing phosphotransfer) domain-containing protein
MTDAAIDRAVLQELEAGTDPEFVRELVATFLTEAPPMLSELRNALAAGNAEAFRRNAHSLKSNCLTFGAKPLGAMARELEHGGLALAGDGTALAALEAEYARVASALAEIAHG